jgi:hypothetical protein
MSNVRISQLNGFTNILGEDYIPLVDSSSVTTYRCTVSDLVGYFALSGSVLSASWASASISSSFSSNSISASYAKTASALIYPNTSTASVSLTTTSASYALSASYARSSSAANSASFASSALSASYSQTSSVAVTASYVNFSTPSTTPPFASSSLSSSWASASISSSYARTASFANNTNTSSYVLNPQNMPFMPKAWATVLIPTSSNYSSDTVSTVNNGNVVNKPIIINSYNVTDVSWATRTQVPVSPYNYGKGTSGTEKESINFLITMATASNNLNYCIVGSAAETGVLTSIPDRTDYGFVTFYPMGRRTSTQFTCSLGGFEFSGNPQFDWFTFVVYA